MTSLSEESMVSFYRSTDVQPLINDSLNALKSRINSFCQLLIVFQNDDKSLNKSSAHELSKECETTVEDIEKALSLLDSSAITTKKVQSLPRKNTVILSPGSIPNSCSSSSNYDLNSTVDSRKRKSSDKSIASIDQASIGENLEVVQPRINESDRSTNAKYEDDRKNLSYTEQSKLKANPNSLVRNVPLGPKKNESKFDFDKRVLIRYKELFGDMVIPYYFIVPWNTDWPEDMWDYRLGYRCCLIRRGKIYQLQALELAKLGFNFSDQRKPFSWETVKSVLIRYKELNNQSVAVPYSFVVPTGSSQWPQVAWGMKLGCLMKDVRLKTSHNLRKDHREELEEIGVVLK